MPGPDRLGELLRSDPSLLELTFDQLRTLLLVRHTGSALRAAQQLGREQSSVQKQLDTLNRRISSERLRILPLVIPAAGIIVDFLHRWYGPGYRNQLTVAAEIDDIYYGLGLLRSHLVDGCMIVTRSIGPRALQGPGLSAARAALAANRTRLSRRPPDLPQCPRPSRPRRATPPTAGRHARRRRPARTGSRRLQPRTPPARRPVRRPSQQLQLRHRPPAVPGAARRLPAARYDRVRPTRVLSGALSPRQALGVPLRPRAGLRLPRAIGARDLRPWGARRRHRLHRPLRGAHRPPRQPTPRALIPLRPALRPLHRPGRPAQRRLTHPACPGRLPGPQDSHHQAQPLAVRTKRP